MKIVVIGDLHAHPDYDIERFDVLGRFCAEQQPDVIVQMGDWADMPSINRHANKWELESRRYSEDVEITQDSLAAFDRPIARRKRKKPRKVFLEGNHENFITRVTTEEPKWRGQVGIEDLGFERFGWERYEYRRRAEIAGFHFVHHLGSQTGRASRVSSPTNGFKSLGVSTVVGHTHTYYRSPLPFLDRRVWGIDVGCCIHKDMGYQENWSCDTEYKYWRGVWIFDNARDGDADFTEVRAETLGC
jgi:predicted phosphodiesterase